MYGIRFGGLETNIQGSSTTRRRKSCVQRNSNVDDDKSVPCERTNPMTKRRFPQQPHDGNTAGFFVANWMINGLLVVVVDLDDLLTGPFDSMTLVSLLDDIRSGYGNVLVFYQMT